MPLRRPRDRAAEVVDEAHREVPVGARDVDRREALHARVLRRELLRVGRELREARRELLDPGLRVRVGPVGDDARAGVVRHAVELAAVDRPTPRGP